MCPHKTQSHLNLFFLFHWSKITFETNINFLTERFQNKIPSILESAAWFITNNTPYNTLKYRINKVFEMITKEKAHCIIQRRRLIIRNQQCGASCLRQ